MLASAGMENQASSPRSTSLARPIERLVDDPAPVVPPTLASSFVSRSARLRRSAATDWLSATFVASASAVEPRSLDSVRDCVAVSANCDDTPANGRAPRISNEPSPAIESNEAASRFVSSAARREASLAAVRLAPACDALSAASDRVDAAGWSIATSSARWRSNPVAALSTAASEPRTSAAAATTRTSPATPNATSPQPRRRRWRARTALSARSPATSLGAQLSPQQRPAREEQEPRDPDQCDELPWVGEGTRQHLALEERDAVRDGEQVCRRLHDRRELLDV